MTTADTVRLGIIKETTAGVTPTNPAFQSIRATGEGVAWTPTIVNSSELTPSRGVTDSALTGAAVSGDISWELSKNAAWETMLEGVFCSTWGDLQGNLIGNMPAGWGADFIAIGKKMNTYTYLKEFDLTGDGSVLSLQAFPESMMNTFQQTCTPGQIITGSYGLIGGTMVPRDTIFPGQTFIPPGVNPVFTAPKVVSVAFLEEDLITPLPIALNTHCFNNLVININNNIRAIECIGTLGAREYALGKAEVTLAAGIYFADDELLNMLIDQDEFAIKILFGDSGASGSIYRYQWIFPRVKLTAAPVVAGGTGQDVVVDAAITALVPDTAPFAPVYMQRIMI